MAAPDDGPIGTEQAGAPRCADGGGRRSAATDNERLTALAGAALLVLIVVELATLPNLHALIAVHVFVGVLLAGPLIVKLGSTGYRFVRYYTGSPAFVSKGRPHQALRVLAPLLIASTLVLVCSGFGMLLVGPNRMRGPLLALHVLSFVVWLPTVVLHTFAHLPQVPRSVGDDWRHGASAPTGRGVRAGLLLAAILAGGALGVLLLGSAVAWTPHVEVAGAGKFLLAAAVIAGVAAAVARPWRWR